MPNRLKPSAILSVFKSPSNITGMKNVFLLCLSIILIAACKNNSGTFDDSNSQQAVKLSNNPADFRAKKDHLEKKLPPVEKRMPDFVPEDGKQNWFAVYSENNHHVCGIFRLPNETAWKEFMSTMNFAEENEINKSLEWQTTEEWWVKRDVLANIKSRNLLAYKREDNTGSWYFAFNPRNFEVYFWR